MFQLLFLAYNYADYLSKRVSIKISTEKAEEYKKLMKKLPLIISILLSKLRKAAVQTGIKNICIAGGVSANSGLRRALQETGQQQGWQVFIPAFEYCTDNAAMIAITGYYKLLAKQTTSLAVGASAKSDW